MCTPKIHASKFVAVFIFMSSYPKLHRFKIFMISIFIKFYMLFLKYER